MRPMLATHGTHVPTGDDWWHEVKWDGMRILADYAKGTDEGRLYSRNGNDVSPAWPEIAPSPMPGRDLLLDGELIALNDEGLPDFRELAERLHVRNRATVARLARRTPATYIVFDLLRLDGQDLADQPLERRRELLEGLALDGDSWHVPATHADGQMLFEATLQQGLEGVVSKHRGSRYEFGTRSRSWVKVPHRLRDSYVVGGWRPQTGSTDTLGALLVGEPTPDGLRYRGRVGSGIGGKASRTLRAALEGLARSESPFHDDVPAEDAQGTRWVDPVVVVDVDTLHRSRRDRLRQPSYIGIRADLTPGDLTKET